MGIKRRKQRKRRRRKGLFCRNCPLGSTGNNEFRLEEETGDHSPVAKVRTEWRGEESSVFNTKAQLLLRDQVGTGSWPLFCWKSCL